MLRQMSADPDLRWKQRFQNFDRAYQLLREAMARGPAALNQLEKEGAIQRFEYCFELGWKTLKDLLEADGFVIVTITPKQVIKDAFVARVITDGQVWMDMLLHRNLLSHTYDAVKFEEAVQAIQARYLEALGSLHEYLCRRAAE